MNCPSCNSSRNHVVDSRNINSQRKRGQCLVEVEFLKGNVVVRRRRCLRASCLTEWWTVESVVKILAQEVDDGIQRGTSDAPRNLLAFVAKPHV